MDNPKIEKNVLIVLDPLQQYCTCQGFLLYTTQDRFFAR